MKAQRPGTDQEAEFHVFNLGVQCPEYILPSTKSSDPNLVECFIEVKPGDELSVCGKFTGSVVHCAFDFVPDGSFAGDARIEGTPGKINYGRLNKKFVKALNCPKPPGWTSLTPSPKMQEGYLAVRALGDSAHAELSRHEVEDEDTTTPGVGSIAVIVSVHQDVLSNYADQERYLSLGAWRESAQTKVRSSGISPDTYLELEVTDDAINPKRSVKHRRHFNATRYGDKAWAKFIFYYRTKESLNAAGCIPRPEVVQELQPWDALIDGAFVFADKDDRTKAAKAKKLAGDMEAEHDGGGLSASDGSAQSLMFASPAPTIHKPKIGKKGRLGGILKLLKDGGVEITSKSDDTETDAVAAQEWEEKQNAPSTRLERPTAPEVKSADVEEEELLEATDDFFEDGDGLFVSISDNGDDDRPNLPRDSQGAVLPNRRLSTTPAPNDKTTNAEMGVVMSSAMTERLGMSKTPEGEASIAPLAAGGAVVNIAGPRTSEDPIKQRHSPGGRSVEVPRAGTKNQSLRNARTNTGYASSSPTASPLLSNLAPNPRAEHATNRPAEIQSNSSVAAAGKEAQQMKQTHRTAAPISSHDKAEVVMSAQPNRSSTPLASHESPSDIDFNRIPTISAIRAAIPPKGISAGQVANLFNSHGPFANIIKAKQIYNQRVGEVANCSGLDARFYLKQAAAPTMPPAQPQAVKQELREEPLEDDCSGGDDGQTVLQPALQSYSTTQHPTGTISAVTHQDRLVNPTPKRSASAMSPAASEQGTPAKRSRLEELAERKAELARSIEAKKARNAAKLKAIEAKREAKEAAKREREQAEQREAALRKEREERELKEIEEMEAAEAEAELQFGELEGIELDMEFEDAADQD